MSKIVVYNTKGKHVGSVSLDKDFMKKRLNSKVLYYAINSYLAARHRGTHKTKKRSEVRGGGKKPWRQKGTGRARFGSIRNPLWRGGGTVFGPVVRSHSSAIPRKAKRTALAEAVKAKIRSEDFVVFDKITLQSPKTKEMAAIIKSLKLFDSCLMVMEDIDKNIKLASRNIAGFIVKRRKDINALDVLRHKKMAIAKESLQKILKVNT